MNDKLDRTLLNKFIEVIIKEYDHYENDFCIKLFTT